MLVETVSVDVPDGVVRNQPQEVFKESKQAVDLTQAEIIVSVGRGIERAEEHRTGEAVGGCAGRRLAASRPICDNGWLPMDRQVGSSGQTVAPKLYLALGILGAIQHLVGIRRAGQYRRSVEEFEGPRRPRGSEERRPVNNWKVIFATGGHLWRGVVTVCW